LEKTVRSERLDAKRLSVALPSDKDGKLQFADRQRVLLHDGQKTAAWQAPPLRDLFRGDRKPPEDIDHYPEEYVGAFYFIEKHLLTACASLGDRTDQEMLDVYSAMRRRPDGKGLSAVHDAVWQAAAVLLGLRPLSEAEFDALFRQLAKSARGWKMGGSSRNYVDYLRENFG
jgi:hypothetical protein